MSSRLRSAPFLSTCAFARITIPGMQNPHWRPPHAANASEYFLRSASSTPSRVVTVRPSARATGYWQLTWALPSIITVQQPHCPEGEQPSFGEVTPSSSRSADSRCGWPDRTDTGVPFTVNETVCGARSVMGQLYKMSTRIARVTRVPVGRTGLA